MRLVLLIQKYLIFVSLNFFFYQQTEFYSDRGFQSESVLSGPPWQRTWVGAENGAAERKTRAAAGQTESALSPCSISAAARAGCLAQKAANELMVPPRTVYTGVFPPQGSSGFANMRDHMLPGDGCSHLQAAKGRNWGPQWGREALGLSKPRRGARRAGRCWVPTGLSGYQAAFVLSDPLLTGIKPLGFSLPETAAAFHPPLGAEAGAPGLSGRGGWASDPQPHLLGQPCQQWQEIGGGGRSGAWKTLSHTWKMSPGLPNTHSSVFIHFSSPYPSISWKTNWEKPKEKTSLFIYFCLFFFQLPNFSCSQLQCPRFFNGYIVRNWKGWKNQRGKEIKKTHHIFKNGQDQIVVSRQVHLPEATKGYEGASP